MSKKNEKPQNEHEYLSGIFEEMTNSKTEDKKIVKESVKEPIVEEKEEKPENLSEDVGFKSFNEITDDILVKEGWFDRFAAKAKGRGAEIGTKASNLANKVKTAGSNIKTSASNLANVAKGNTANVKNMQQATSSNPEHAKIQRTIESVYKTGFLDSIQDLVKLGLISATNVGRIDADLRKVLSSTITNILQSENKLASDESLVIKNADGQSFIKKNTPVVSKTPNPKKQTTPNAPVAPKLGGKTAGVKKTPIPTNP